MNRSFKECHERAKKINPDFERINGVIFADVKEMPEQKLFTLKELKIAGCVAAAVTLWSVWPALHDHVDYWWHMGRYITAVEDAADNVRDVIDDNKEELSANSMTLATSDFAKDYPSLVSSKETYLTNAEVGLINLEKTSKDCEAKIKQKQNDPSYESETCVLILNKLVVDLNRQVEGYKDYNEKVKLATAAKKEVNEIYDDMLNKINGSAIATSAKAENSKIYGANDKFNYRGDLMLKINRDINYSVSIDDFNKRMAKLIEKEKLNAQEVFKKEHLSSSSTPERLVQLEPIEHSASSLQQEQAKQAEQPVQQNQIIQPEQQKQVMQAEQQKQTVQRVVSYDFYMPPPAVLQKINALHDEVVKLQSVYDNKTAELNKILGSRDAAVQQKFKSKIRVIDRIDPSTTPAHASEDECNNSIAQLERSADLLKKGIYQLDSAIQFLNKNK